MLANELSQKCKVNNITERKMKSRAGALSNQGHEEGKII